MSLVKRTAILAIAALVIFGCSTRSYERLLEEKLGNKGFYSYRVTEFSKNEYSIFLSEKLVSFDKADIRWKTIASVLCPFGHKLNNQSSVVDVVGGKLSQHKAGTIVCNNDLGQLPVVETELHPVVVYEDDVEIFSFHYPYGWEQQKWQHGSSTVVSVRAVGSEFAVCMFVLESQTARSVDAQLAEVEMKPAEWVLSLSEAGYEDIRIFSVEQVTVGQHLSSKAEFDATFRLAPGRDAVKAIAYSLYIKGRSYLNICLVAPPKDTEVGLVYGFYSSTFNKVLKSFRLK